MSFWFDRAFGGWYERLYPHRGQAEADRAAATLFDGLPAGRVLDAGCGTGRHLRTLAARGRDAWGIDRSPTLLRSAASDPALAPRVVRADMRHLPFPEHAFGSVLSMFTSFGYFRGAGEHEALLREFRRVTREGGVLVLDYLNPHRVRRDLVPESRRTVEGHEVVERRFVEHAGGEDAVIKELTISRDGTTVESYREEVTLYDPEEVDGMLESAGWSVRDRLGDYGGDPWTETSPRTIFRAAAAS